MLPHVIGINGFAGSGKDTVADYFIQNYGYKKIAMADAVKDVLAVVFGWDRAMLQGDTKESRDWRNVPDAFWSKQLGTEFTPRIAMQQIGTDLFRNYFNQEIWCMIVKRKILYAGSKVIITDLRFANEIAMAREFECMLLEVQRGEQPAWYNLASEQNRCKEDDLDDSMTYSMESCNPQIHPSEWEWVGINRPKYTIDNNKSLSDLYEQLDKISSDAA